MSHPQPSVDAETILRAARRPLVIGIGGGGDVVGALATAELMQLYDERDPVVHLGRIALVAGAGGLCGARGLTPPVAEALEGAIRLVPTEASAQAVRAFRGGAGATSIRGGQRSFELSTVASVTFYLDVTLSLEAAGPLAAAVIDAGGLEAANEALRALGVRSELDLERSVAAENVTRHP